jgi:parallel beta-helix repeat protein
MEAGVFIHDEAGGQIAGNDIFENTWHGVAITDEGTDPLVIGNTIRDGMYVGVHVCDAARGTIERNDVFGNTMAGM